MHNEHTSVANNFIEHFMELLLNESCKSEKKTKEQVVFFGLILQSIKKTQSKPTSPFNFFSCVRTATAAAIILLVMAGSEALWDGISQLLCLGLLFDPILSFVIKQKYICKSSDYWSQLNQSEFLQHFTSLSLTISGRENGAERALGSVVTGAISCPFGVAFVLGYKTVQ